MAKSMKTRFAAEARSASEPPVTTEELRQMHEFWRASNYLAAGMIYLRANPLLRENNSRTAVRRGLQ